MRARPRTGSAACSWSAHSPWRCCAARSAGALAPFSRAARAATALVGHAGRAGGVDDYGWPGGVTTRCTCTARSTCRTRASRPRTASTRTTRSASTSSRRAAATSRRTAVHHERQLLVRRLVRPVPPDRGQPHREYLRAHRRPRRRAPEAMAVRRAPRARCSTAAADAAAAALATPRRRPRHPTSCSTSSPIVRAVSPAPRRARCVL